MGDDEVEDEEKKSSTRLSITQKVRPSKMSKMRHSMRHKSLSRMKLRKQSFGFSSIHGLRPVERSSQIAIEYKRPILMYFPTYQLDSRLPFHVARVKKEVEASIEEAFTGHIYHLQESPALALRVTTEILRKVKAMGFNRYRCLTIVTVRQKRAQSYGNAVSFLWDHERDNYVDVQKEVTTAFIQATVFGVYLD